MEGVSGQVFLGYVEFTGLLSGIAHRNDFMFIDAKRIGDLHGSAWNRSF